MKKQKRSGSPAGLTHDRLVEVLNYNKRTGVFKWSKKISKKVVVGHIAGGGPSLVGYWRIRIDGKLYQAHRLAWLYVYGEWPGETIDHINGDKLDNRIINLRSATYTENNQNKLWHRKGKLPGVTKRRGKYEASIKYKGDQYYLGLFSTEREANKAYLLALATLEDNYA